MEYVLKTRLAAAAELLSATELSVTEIGVRCGFSSPAYFSRVFKEETGLSPLRYRKTHVR
jgi:transcriptional regulator GlxA family with amidase domain